MTITDIQFFAWPAVGILVFLMGMILGIFISGSNYLVKQARYWSYRFIFVCAMLIFFSLVLLPMIDGSLQHGIYHTHLTDEMSWLLFFICWISSLWLSGVIIKKPTGPRIKRERNSKGRIKREIA